jgi:hypothetical protein
MTSSQIFEQFEQSSHKSYFINIQLLEEAAKIEALFARNNIPLIRIKGIGLLNTVYPDISKRNLSDIDILIPQDQVTAAEELLRQQGYSLYPQKKWMANHHKQDFRREDNLQYSIDLHTKLIFFEKPDFEWKTYKIENTYHLEPQDHFFYLIYNWIYQDTMIGLHKFYDIYQVYAKYNSQFDWQRLTYLTKEFKMEKTMKICFALLKKHFNIHVENSLSSKNLNISWLSDSFLKDPKSQPIKYFLLKHKNKPLKEAVYYDFKWVEAYWKPIFKLFYLNWVK